MFKKRKREIEEKLEKKRPLHSCRGANFFGIKSAGSRQVRGNGMLALLESELFFEMWRPKRELHVPLKAIEQVEIVKSFLRKTKSQPLLKISFVNHEGDPDEAAWLVRDPEAWIELITKHK
ncbi:hypothetical protein GF325_05945 [Candidatus Bathyarchaeota archaeon]|nr:hypothetical protein [Candidatus Bathyarchaeota archaeon]